MNISSDNFSRVLFALLLCAGLILTSCEEFPFFDGENSEQNGNGNTGEENVGGENTGDNEYAGSSDGAANCYIISEVGLYKFKTVKGNSDTSVGSASSAEVLWESFGTDVTPNVGDLIKWVAYKDGYIAFQTADTFKEGNAVIAVKDASGNILWSWHIWLTDQPRGQEYYNNAGTMMDRNLGATSATPGDVETFGLFYQWGRKDPFLGSSSNGTPTFANSTITWPSVVKSDSSNGTIEYAVSHPTTFIVRNERNYDWYYTGDERVDNTRWTTADKTKSIYDPCPAGWRVPDGGDNGVWSKACGSSSDFSSYHYDSLNNGMNFSGKFGSDQTIWYPASSYLIDYSCEFYDIISYGAWWSASSDGYYIYNLNLGSNNIVRLSGNDHRADGRSVRCIRE